MAVLFLQDIQLSGISGDKTQPLMGVSDYWIVKTDSLGNKQWDKHFGTELMMFFLQWSNLKWGIHLGWMARFRNKRK